MHRLVINSGGLGATASDTAAQCVQLGYASYLTNPSCWGQSYESWQEQYYGPNTLTITPPPAPGTPSDLTALPDTTGDAAQALSNAALAAAAATNVALNPVTADACQNFTNEWPYPFGNMDCPTAFLWGAGILAALLLLPRLIK